MRRTSRTVLLADKRGLGHDGCSGLAHIICMNLASERPGKRSSRGWGEVEILYSGVRVFPDLVLSVHSNCAAE